MIVLRSRLKGKISLRIQYGLWLLVAIRLLMPFSIGETTMSIDNWLDSATDTQEFQNVVKLTQTPLLNIGYGEVEQITGGYTIENILFVIWITGMILLTMWFLFTSLRLSKQLKKSRKLLGTVDVLLEKEWLEAAEREKLEHMDGELLPVYQTDVVDTPCLFGHFFPVIYVTTDLAERENGMRHAIEHECTHYMHRDDLWSLLRVVCLILHWYNPLVWYAAILSKNDAELACDEATIQRLGEDERAAYGHTLIGLTCEKRPSMLITATTMTGSKNSINERIMLIAQKPKMRTITIVILVLIVQCIIGWVFTGAKLGYESFEEWADGIEVDLIQWAQVSKGYAKEQVYYALSAEEIAQIVPTLQSIPEEKCYRRVNRYDTLKESRLVFMYAGLDMIFICQEDGTVLLLQDTELPFAPEGKVLIIDSPELYEYISAFVPLMK